MIWDAIALIVTSLWWFLKLSITTCLILRVLLSHQLIQGLDVGPDATRVAVLPYNNGTTVFLDNPYTAAELSQIIQQLPKEDEKTDTSSALKKMRESIFSMDRGDRPGYRDIGIIITDGSSEVPGQELTIPVEVEPNDDGIAMIALGIGPQANSKVQALASSPEQGLILTDSELEMMKKDLIDIICNHVSGGWLCSCSNMVSYVHICAERLRSGGGRVLTLLLSYRGYVHTYAEWARANLPFIEDTDGLERAVSKQTRKIGCSTHLLRSGFCSCPGSAPPPRRPICERK